MNFVADENVDAEIVQRLRQDGHRVWYVAEMDPGISDDAVLSIANRESALLLTGDKDFGELIFRQQQLSSGVVLVRLAGLSADKKADVISLAISKHAAMLPHSFSVISPGAIRIRRATTEE